MVALHDRKAYAVCAEHAGVALEYMEGRKVHVRPNKGHASRRCHCEKVADYFLVEVMDEPAKRGE